MVFLTGGEIYSQDSNTISEDFNRIANKIASHAEEINNVWPGFWSDGESFLLMKYDSVIHVYNVTENRKVIMNQYLQIS